MCDSKPGMHQRHRCIRSDAVSAYVTAAAATVSVMLLSAVYFSTHFSHVFWCNACTGWAVNKCGTLLLSISSPIND